MYVDRKKRRDNNNTLPFQLALTVAFVHSFICLSLSLSLSMPWYYHFDGGALCTNVWVCKSLFIRFDFFSYLAFSVNEWQFYYYKNINIFFPPSNHFLCSDWFISVLDFLVNIPFSRLFTGLICCYLFVVCGITEFHLQSFVIRLTFLHAYFMHRFCNT